MESNDYIVEKYGNLIYKICMTKLYKYDLIGETETKSAADGIILKLKTESKEGKERTNILYYKLSTTGV